MTELTGIDQLIAALVAGARIAGHPFTTGQVARIRAAAHPGGPPAGPALIDRIADTGVGELIGTDAAARMIAAVHLTSCTGRRTARAAATYLPDRVLSEVVVHGAVVAAIIHKGMAAVDIYATDRPDRYAVPYLLTPDEAREVADLITDMAAGPAGDAAVVHGITCMREKVGDPAALRLEASWDIRVDDPDGPLDAIGNHGPLVLTLDQAREVAAALLQQAEIARVDAATNLTSLPKKIRLWAAPDLVRARGRTLVYAACADGRWWTVSVDGVWAEIAPPDDQTTLLPLGTACDIEFVPAPDVCECGARITGDRFVRASGAVLCATCAFGPGPEDDE